MDGFGAVVHDPASGDSEFFGALLWPDVAAELRAVTGHTQIIAQLELLPIYVALLAWRRLFRDPGRRVVVFVDNDAARFGLIRGYSPNLASRALIEATWQQAATLQLAPWFERVPTSGNPADAASRLRPKELASLRPAPRHVEVPSCRRAVRRILGNLGD